MFNQMRNRTPLPNVPAAPAATQDINAVLQGILAANQAAINASTEATNKLVAALIAQNSHQYSFSKYPVIDLTTAHTNLEITVIRPVSFIQIWSDGGLDGISLRIGQQSNEPVDFRQMQVIPVVDNPEKIYFTNDVRQGRSRAVIYFVQGPYPLSLAIAGQDISQAELAVRNGSIHSFDRRGDVLFMDDFEDGILKWQQTLSAVALESITASTDVSKNGAVSAKLVTGATIGNLVGLYRFMPYVALTKWGLEVSFSYNNALSVYEFWLQWFTGITRYQAQLLYTTATGVLSIYTPAGYVNLLPAVVLSANAIPANVIKLVVDTATGKYVRAILNNTIIDIKNYDVFRGADVSAPVVIPSFRITTGVNVSHTAYFDDAIVTHNEP